MLYRILSKLSRSVENMGRHSFTPLNKVCLLTAQVFTKLIHTRQLSLQNSSAEFHKHSTIGLVADISLAIETVPTDEYALHIRAPFVLIRKEAGKLGIEVKVVFRGVSISYIHTHIHLHLFDTNLSSFHIHQSGLCPSFILYNSGLSQ